MKAKRTNKAVPSSADQHIGAVRSRHALVGGYGEAAVIRDPVGAITNLLCDLRLFCDERGLPFSELDDNAYEQYLKEVIGG